MKGSERSVGCILLFAMAIGGLLAMLIAVMLSSTGGFADSVKPADIAVLVLSALSVMVAILTLFLGVLAFFGWTAFHRIVEDRAHKVFDDRFDASNDRYRRLLERFLDDARAKRDADPGALGYEELNNDDEEGDEEIDGGGEGHGAG